MHSLASFLHPVAVFFRPHLEAVAIGIAATLLIIYGDSINGFFRRQTLALHFAVRFILFVLLCSIGYAFLTSELVKLLHSYLSGMNDVSLVISVVAAFLILAFLARAGKAV